MTLSGGPLERRSMSDEAFVRLQDAIISGELQPGERLRDYELAERLGKNEDTIVEEFAKVQGEPVDIGGYYYPDWDKTADVMRPSATFNSALADARE